MYARKIRSALASYIGRVENAQAETAEEAIRMASKKIEDVVNPIVTSIQEEANRVQEQYDNEIGHRLGDPVKQAEWKVKIRSWLGE